MDTKNYNNNNNNTLHLRLLLSLLLLLTTIQLLNTDTGIDTEPDLNLP